MAARYLSDVVQSDTGRVARRHCHLVLCLRVHGVLGGIVDRLNLICSQIHQQMNRTDGRSRRGDHSREWPWDQRARDVRKGNGCQSPCRTDQLGPWITAPLRPHFEHLAHCRSPSLDASIPQRIINGANVMGALWPQPWPSQCTHTHGVSRWISASVGTVIRQRPQV